MITKYDKKLKIERLANLKLNHIFRFKHFVENSKLKCKFYEYDIVHLKNYDSLICLLESDNQKIKIIYEVSLGAVNVAKILKTYNIKIGFDFSKNTEYSYAGIKEFFPVENNLCLISSNSMYGHYTVNIKYNKYCIRIIVPSKSSDLKKSLNLIQNKEISPKDIVYLDLETTGLNPIADDIIEMAFYDANKKISYAKKLPLVKTKEVRKEITEINHISTDMLKGLKKLTQKEVNQIIKKFNLKKKAILMWSGSNYFDAQFLTIWFYENGYKGIEHLKFYNGKELADKYSNRILSYDHSKDALAREYRIPLEKNHTALGDCIIESKIYENLYKERFDDKKTIIEIIKDNLLKDTIDDYRESYSALIRFCRDKYGDVDKDYDENPKTRGAEWLDIHHTFEDEIDNIGVKTQEAIKNNDKNALAYLKKYNRHYCLIYANKIEHFLLHSLISKIRGPGGGPHWLFGDILRYKYNLNLSSTTKIFKGIHKDKIFQHITFNEICLIYKDILSRDKHNYEQLLNFWKLQDSQKIRNIIKEIALTIKSN